MSYANIIPATLAFATVGASYFLVKKGFPKCSTVLDFGRGQKYCGEAGAAETILKYVHLPPNSHMNVMTDDFQKWISSRAWMDFVTKSLDLGSTITAFAAGNAHETLPPEIASLRKNKNLEIVLCGSEPFEKHITTVSSPQQIWYEEKHIGHFADNCIYTRYPHQEIWGQIEKYFSLLRLEKVA